MPERRAPQLPPTVHSAAGATAGALQTVFWHPLDLLKTRLQVQGARIESGGVPAYRSLAHAVRSLLQAEGPLGFLRGVLPNVVGSSLAWGIQMPLYAHLKSLVHEDMQTPRSLFYFAPKDVACSFTAGCITNMFVHPVFLVKTRMQLQPRARAESSVNAELAKPVYRNSVDAVVRILQEEGIAGLYRGFVPSLLLSTHGAVLLVSYDHFKALYPSVVVASFSAKVFATMATYPLQVVRTVMQQRPSDHSQFPYTSFKATAHDLWQRGGMPAFYRGIFPQMMRTLPQSVAFFSIYEYLMGAFSNMWLVSQRSNEAIVSTMKR